MSLMAVYNRADLSFTHGTGAYLYTEDGRKFLDFSSGIAVTSLGHGHPHLIAALTAQAQKLWHVSNGVRIPGQERLAARLTAASFADQVFFTNSGVEAIECGFKLLRKYHDKQGQPDRYRVITCRGAFHGRSLATIAAGGNPKYMAGFDPAVDGFDQVAFGNMNELRAAITSQTAAILIEPVQGEGGLRAADGDYLRALRAVADEFGLLLFLDEVQCGIGRTGKFLAHEWAGIQPDIVAIAKGLGGGFPVGACLATDKVASAFGIGSHGTTFGGNPLAMAVGNAVLDIILAPGFLDQVNKTAQILWQRLGDLVTKYPHIYREVRGKGLMLGIQCGPENTKIQGALRQAGMLSVTAGDNVLRLLPPLIIGAAEIDLAVEMLDRVARMEGDKAA